MNTSSRIEHDLSHCQSMRSPLNLPENDATRANAACYTAQQGSCRRPQPLAEKW